MCCDVLCVCCLRFALSSVLFCCVVTVLCCFVCACFCVFFVCARVCVFVCAHCLQTCMCNLTIPAGRSCTWFDSI